MLLLTAVEVETPAKSHCKIVTNDEDWNQYYNSNINCFADHPDQFHVFKAGSVFPILGSVLPFCLHN